MPTVTNFPFFCKYKTNSKYYSSVGNWFCSYIIRYLNVSHYIFRCIKLLETTKKKILALRMNDVTNEELFINLQNIRAKFKQVMFEAT